MTLSDILARLRQWWRGDYEDSALYIGSADQVPDHQFKDLTRRLREKQDAARDALGERHLLHPSHSPKKRKPTKVKRKASTTKRKMTPRGKA